MQLVGVDVDSAVTTLGWASCSPAVVGTMMAVPSPLQTPTWQLDVGPTVWPLVAAPEPESASVTESAAGSLLVLQLPGIHVSGQEEIEGEIALDRLPLAAKVITDGATARLEAFVSGLAGSPKIATHFGAVPLRQTGLCLDIGGDGEMSVAAFVPPPPKPAAAPSPAVTKSAPPVAKKAPATKAPAKKTPGGQESKAPATKAPVTKAPASKVAGNKAPAKASPTKRAAGKKAPVKPLTTVQKLRRRLPPALEPLAKRVSKSSAARDLYRRFAGL